MRRIEKGPEPVCLEDLRQTPGADWSSVSGAQKQQMREHARNEQRGLCAYCMSRLPAPSADGMKIEHFIPRAQDKDSWFAWSNLLGVCMGVIVEGAEDRFHCDTYRGNLSKEHQTLHIHPAQFPPDAGSMFSCTDAGELRPAAHLAAEEQAKIAQTIDRLNLNIDRLKRNRARVRASARKLIQQGRVTQRRLSELLTNAKRTDNFGCLTEYAEVAVQYFEKKLRQIS